MRKSGIRSTKTIVDWLNFFRDFCFEAFNRNTFLLGGAGRVVEIDEALLVIASTLGAVKFVNSGFLGCVMLHRKLASYLQFLLTELVTHFFL